VEDNDTVDFYCPTSVKQYKGVIVSHYRRKRIDHNDIAGTSYYQYTGLVPPFIITWYTTNGSLWVDQYDPTTVRQEILYKTNQDFTNFIKTCQRFKVLVPFS
jgi:hypothetical protein